MRAATLTAIAMIAIMLSGGRALGANFGSLTLKAGVHVNYADSVLRMKDWLPKLKDYPRELGGSGEIVPE